MSFLAGTAIKLSNRVFLIPWVRSNCCAKGRDYSSKFPVKYIPKKTSTGQNSESHSNLPKRLDKKRNNNSRQVKLNIEQVGYSKNSIKRHTDAKFDNCYPYHDFRTSDPLPLEAEEKMAVDLSCANDDFVEEIDEIEGDLLGANDEFFARDR